MGFKDGISKAVGRMMGTDLGQAVKSLYGFPRTIETNTFRGFEYENLTGEEEMFYEAFGDSSSIHFRADSCMSYVKAYFECPPLSAVINKKAQAFTNGVSYIINTKGKGKDREAVSDEAVRISKLMADPNPLQTGDEFFAQNYINVQLFGFCVVLFLGKPFGMSNSYSESMWNIPSHFIRINEKPGVFYRGGNIERIEFSYGGENVVLPLDAVHIIRDIMPSFTSVVIPDSRVRTLAMPINNIIGAYESRNMLINSRGALGMLTNETQDAGSFIQLKPDEKKRILSDFKKLYGLKKNQSHVIITSANLKWQKMVLPTKDLMLFEEIEDDANRICDTYMFPPVLLGKMSGGTTFSNMGTASRSLYEDAIMPEAKSIYSQWNKIFETQKSNLEIGREYKHLPALQNANKEEAEGKLRMQQAYQILFRNNGCKLNDMRIAMGLEPDTEYDVRFSDIKDDIATSKADTNTDASIESTQMSDNTNPGDGNPGTPGAQK